MRQPLRVGFIKQNLALLPGFNTNNRSENYYLLAIAAVMITLATALGWDIKTT